MKTLLSLVYNKDNIRTFCEKSQVKNKIELTQVILHY